MQSDCELCSLEHVAQEACTSLWKVYINPLNFLKASHAPCESIKLNERVSFEKELKIGLCEQ